MLSSSIIVGCLTGFGIFALQPAALIPDGRGSVAVVPMQRELPSRDLERSPREDFTESGQAPTLWHGVLTGSAGTCDAFSGVGAFFDGILSYSVSFGCRRDA